MKTEYIVEKFNKNSGQWCFKGTFFYEKHAREYCENNMKLIIVNIESCVEK